MSKNLFAAAMVFILITGCTKNDPQKESLREAINDGAMELNSAVGSISSMPAFSILTSKDEFTTKSAAADYKVYITLDTIKGIYDYVRPSSYNLWGMSIMNFFTRTGESEQMIVNMPLKKVMRSWLLRNISKADTSLENNFTIKVSEYHNNYNSFHDYDYLLESEISIDDKYAGSLNINALVKPVTGRNYTAGFKFPNGYTAGYSYESGDTALSSFTIKNDDKVLYGEQLIIISNDTSKIREHQYVLTVGDVQIIRKSGSHEISVLVNGKVQPGAKVEIIDRKQDSEASVCKERDIQLTFEDGTRTTISALIGESVEDIRSIYSSLHQVYFAASVVDWIAYNIYYHR